MPFEFTPRAFHTLITTFQNSGCSFHPFYEIVTNLLEKTVVFRHDVDLRPHYALELAQLEANLGIHGTYYFRIVPESFDPDVMQQIAELGHEVGYHYEDLTLVGREKKVGSKKYVVSRERVEKNYKTRLKELDEVLERGIENFERNLETMRRYVDVKTICMHGSPLSRWDSRLLWTKYDYREFGIIGEPYFDVNFNEVLYLTDTGRRWDGDAVSVRDKPLEAVEEFVVPVQTDPHKPRLSEHYRFHSTFDIIRAAQEGRLPDRMMLTIHPQRWTSRVGPWVRELVWQNVKNVVKRMVVKRLRGDGGSRE